jgi:tRNA(adenine34) deaminase
MASHGPNSMSAAPFSIADEQFMRLALAEAKAARMAGEVPVGAVLVRDSVVLSHRYNAPIGLNDPSAHAEVLALREAAQKAANYRLTGCTLYVTLEPCVMCAGLIVIARLERLVFAARDIRFGAVRSKFTLADSDILNHRVSIEEGLLASEAAELLSDFFAERRDR